MSNAETEVGPTFQACLSAVASNGSNAIPVKDAKESVQDIAEEGKTCAKSTEVSTQHEPSLICSEITEGNPVTPLESSIESKLTAHIPEAPSVTILDSIAAAAFPEPPHEQITTNGPTKTNTPAAALSTHPLSPCNASNGANSAAFKGSTATSHTRRPKCKEGIIGIPVYLNVYSMTRSALFAAGLRIYHSGVEVLGKEWQFGAPPAGSNPALCSQETGVYWVTPRTAYPTFCDRILLGYCTLQPSEIGKVVRNFCAAREWMMDRYDPFMRNCNHFTAVFAAGLNSSFVVPSWVNRAATMGAQVLPSWTRRLVGFHSQSLSQAPQQLPSASTPPLEPSDLTEKAKTTRMNESVPAPSNASCASQVTSTAASPTASVSNTSHVSAVTKATTSTSSKPASSPSLNDSLQEFCQKMRQSSAGSGNSASVDAMASTLQQNLADAIRRSGNDEAKLPSKEDLASALQGDYCKLWYAHADRPTCAPAKGSYLDSNGLTVVPGHPKYDMKRAKGVPMPPVKGKAGIPGIMSPFSPGALPALPLGVK